MRIQYTLKVYPAGLGRSVYRTITICGTDTLDQLCMAILNAFDFTAEHLYEFCMDNKMYSEDCYYLLVNAGIIGIPCVSLQVMCIPAPIAGFLLGGGVRNQLVASAKVVQLAHQIDPDNKVGCMCAGFFAFVYLRSQRLPEAAAGGAGGILSVLGCLCARLLPRLCKVDLRQGRRRDECLRGR